MKKIKKEKKKNYIWLLIYHLKPSDMAFQVTFTKQILYKLLTDDIIIDKLSGTKFTANAILFQPMFEKQKIINIQAFSAYHNPNSNKPIIRLANGSFRTGVIAWTDTFSKKLLGTPGSPNLNGPSFEYNELDNMVNKLSSSGSTLSDKDGPIVRYDFVIFTNEQIRQVFKDNDLEVDGESFKKIILKHGIKDYYDTYGTTNKRCRKSIYLVAMSSQNTVAAQGPIAIQDGQPCPPDWWTFDAGIKGV